MTPGHREEFLNVALEGPEAGVPVVATRAGAVPGIAREPVDGFPTCEKVSMS